MNALPKQRMIGNKFIHDLAPHLQHILTDPPAEPSPKPSPEPSPKPPPQLPVQPPQKLPSRPRPSFQLDLNANVKKIMGLRDRAQEVEAALEKPLDSPVTVSSSTPLVAALVDGPVCPHGGMIDANDVPHCGFCLGIGATVEESFDAFLISLYDVAKRVARNVGVGDKHKMGFKDRFSEIFNAILLNPKNLRSIAEANNPMAKAFTIAKRRLNNVYTRDPFFETSQMSKTEAKEEPSAADIRRRRDLASLNDPRSGNTNEYLDDDDADVPIFPGFEKLWTPQHIRSLINLMNEALDKLERQPIGVAMLIKLRHGAVDIGLPVALSFGATWQELVEHVEESTGRVVTVDQVRYAVAKGEEAIRAHILGRLVSVTALPDRYKSLKAKG